ncbi:MAG: RloB family protein [Crocinitomicaceae bacterium]
MQDKKQKQIEKARAHKLRLANIKAKRRGEPTIERSAPKLTEKPIILIYCEGVNTEPSYFNKFKLTSMDVKSFGEGRNTLSLVERAKTISDKKNYDQIWCVFDADPKPDNPKQLENFNSAIVTAEKYGFGVAYTNQAFEYWLILHFEDHQGSAMDRKDYGDKINLYINKLGVHYAYNGDKLINQDFFDLLNVVVKIDREGNEFTRKDLAIARAERNQKHLDNINPGKEESSTTVHKLVRVLNEYN